MKIVKNYDNFSEEYRLNENLLAKAWGKVIEFFKRKFGKHAWIYYALYLKKSKQLPSDKIELYCPDSYFDKKVPTQKEIDDSQIDLYSDELSLGKNKSDNGPMDVGLRSSKAVKEGLEEDEGYITLAASDLNMPDVHVKELKEAIREIYNMNKNRAARHEAHGYDYKDKNTWNIKSPDKRKNTFAIFIWGAPGIGKTEILSQLAKELDIALLEWHLATLEPTDFRGVPKVQNDRTVTKLPAIFPTSDGENGKGGIMFFDELNRATPMVLAASLSLALSGKHGEYEIPPRWIIMAAGNRTDDIDTGVLTDDPILWNRFFHVNYYPTIDEWLDYLSKQKHTNPDLIDFMKIRENQKYYHRLSTNVKPPNWPSPRSWEQATEEDFFERAEDWKNRLPISKVMQIYQDMVGYDAAKAFSQFVEKAEEKRRLERIEKEKKAREKLGKGGKLSKKELDDLESNDDFISDDEPDELGGGIDKLNFQNKEKFKETPRPERNF
jgi:hypothetical protein